MGTKRPSGDATHPSRKPHISGHSNKRHKSSPYDNAIHSSHKSANNLKSKIRDLTRLLDHSKDLPADVRIEKERALAGYRVDLESAQGERRRSDMIKRYHMVRFFERQKASRQLKRLQSQLDTVADESSERKTLQSAVHRAEVDLNYTMYYPLAEKYQSLYPRVEPHRVEDDGQTARVDETDKRRLEGRKPPLWPLIERAMRESTLEALRDGNGDRVVSVNTKSQLAIPRKAAAQGAEAKHILDVNRLGKTQSVGEALTDNNDDGASDGGFFEE